MYNQSKHMTIISKPRKP